MATAAGRLPAALDRALPLLAAEARRAGRLTPEGYLDLLGPGAPESTGVAQDLMTGRIVPTVYERWWRPALGRVAKGLLGPGMSDEHRIARLLLGLSPGDGVLDVACGTGNFTRDFARSVGPDGLVVGIDVSETMLGRAVRDTAGAGLLDRAAYVRGDATELPFLESSFDGVCCFAALHLFADPMRALDRMTRVLTPGGRIAIFTSVRGRSGPLRTFESIAGGRSGMRMFERNEVVDALEARGYREIRQRITGLTQFVGGRLAG
jgi:SAM-dependent methyltransferase